MAEPYLEHSIKVDGIRIPIITDLSFSQFGKMEESVDNIESVYPFIVEISDYIDGSASFMAPADAYVNDPMTFLQMLGLKSSYLTYNTTTSSFEYGAVYDFGELDQPDGDIVWPKTPIEIRQLEAGVTDTIDSDATYTQYAIKFKAGGEDITKVKLFVNDVTGNEVTTLSLEVWTDVADEPGVQVVSTNTAAYTGLTVPSDTGDWLVLSDLEEGATYDLLDSEELVVGDDYWLVVIATDTDPLTFHGTTNDNYGNVLKYDGTWDAVANSMLNATFIIQFLHEQGGHTVEIVSTASNGDTRTILLKGCKVLAKVPEVSPQKTTKLGFDFKSYSYTITYS